MRQINEESELPIGFFTVQGYWPLNPQDALEGCLDLRDAPHGDRGDAHAHGGDRDPLPSLRLIQYCEHMRISQENIQIRHDRPR